MQAMFLHDACRLFCCVNAALRTYGKTFAAADTFIGYVIPARFFLDLAERKGYALDGFLGKIEPFAAAAEYYKRKKAFTGCFGRVDLIHIRIFFEKA